MEKLLLMLIFVPLVVGFILLFTPAKWKLLHRGCGLIISAFAFLAAIKLYTAGKIVFDQSILDIWQVKLNLLLETNHRVFNGLLPGDTQRLFIGIDHRSACCDDCACSVGFETSLYGFLRTALSAKTGNKE